MLQILVHVCLLMASFDGHARRIGVSVNNSEQLLRYAVHVLVAKSVYNQSEQLQNAKPKDNGLV